MGLIRQLGFAKRQNDLERRDAVLEEMRRLQQAWPQDPAVRERLVRGLFDTIIAAKAENDLEHRDALLEEMRRLQQAWPQDAVPEWLIATIARLGIYSEHYWDLERI
jgi:flagellin-specific chaperone FliS